MLIDAKSKKVFEKPDTGLFLGVLADIIYVKDKPTKFGPKDVARLVWILDAKDKEGNHYRVMTEANQSMHENARLYAIIKDIQLGIPPAVPFDPDSLIGTVRKLVIVRETSEDGKKDFANIKAYTKPNDGEAFAIPTGFVRSKDKVRTQTSTTTSTVAPAPSNTAVTGLAAPAPVATTAPVAAAPVSNDEDIPF